MSKTLQLNVVPQVDPTMTVYGKWVAISNPSYPDGCELLTDVEFAEESEHIALETATDGEVYALYQADYSFGTFTGV